VDNIVQPNLTNENDGSMVDLDAVKRSLKSVIEGHIDAQPPRRPPFFRETDAPRRGKRAPRGGDSMNLWRPNMRRDAVFFTILITIPSVVLPITGYRVAPPQTFLLAAFSREKGSNVVERLQFSEKPAPRLPRGR
jgi:hypothetical protein